MLEYCTHCGARLNDDDDFFCPVCGEPLESLDDLDFEESEESPYD